MRWGKVGDQ